MLRHDDENSDKTTGVLRIASRLLKAPGHERGTGNEGGSATMRKSAKSAKASARGEQGLRLSSTTMTLDHK
jgi:hypothetical protein